MRVSKNLMRVSKNLKFGGNHLRRQYALWFAVGASLPWSAHAGTGRIWIADSSTWNTATNWFALPGGGSGVPVSGDDAYLTQLDAVDRIVTFEGTYVSPASLASLTIDASGTGSMTLSQTSANRFRADAQYIGDAGRGSYAQSAGTNDANTVYLGYSATGNGNYSLSNSASLNIASGMYVGFTGSGKVNQTGGAVTVTSGAELVLGYLAGSSGTYNFSGGTLTTPGLRLGDDAGASGQFVHFGGTATISGDLEIASSTLTSLGSYVISSGTLVVARNLILGEAGTGVFNQSGGIVQINPGGTNGLIIGWSPISGTNPASIGTYTLSGTGLLSVTGRVYVGFAGNGMFTQTGGTHNINGALVIASTTGSNTSSADYVLQSGTLNVQGAGVIQLNAGGGFTENGGTLTYTTFNMDGGTVNGTLTNGGAFNYNAGNFAGRLVNAFGSTANFNDDFTAGNGMANATALSITADRTITLNGAGLNNTGTIQLQGSVLTGAGPLVNNGTLSGTGEVGGTGGLTNAATWNVGAGNYNLTNTGANANSGTINVAASAMGVSLVLDGVGVGLVNSGTINLSTNAAISGTGTLVNKPTGIINAGQSTISSGLNNQGQINVGVGDLSVTLPFANSGNIALQGNALNGGSISNTGSIIGAGTVSNPITNAGNISVVVSGQMTLAGFVLNQAAGQMNVGAATTMTANLSDNSGVINVSAGGTFSASAFTNSGPVNIGGTLDTDGITNTGPITYSGGASIDSFGPIINNAGGAIALGAGGPTVVFYDNITHNPGAALTIAAGATANFLGNITGGGNATNAGTINFNSGKTYTLGNLSGGGSTVLFEGAQLSAARINQSSLTLNASGTLAASVSIAPAATAGTQTSKVNSLVIAGGSAPAARLDLANTNLVVDYTGVSPIATIRAQVRSGFNAPGTPWTGNGITSSTAAAGGGTALGYAEASVALALSGTDTTTWFGQTVDATSVLIRFTKAGDADLDGAVGFPDLVKVAQHYGDSSGNRIWYDGDFNYDGNIDFSDLVIVAQNYGTSLPAPPVGALSAGFMADFAAARESVPEPGVAGFAVAGALSFLARRRRVRHE